MNEKKNIKFHFMLLLFGLIGGFIGDILIELFISHIAGTTPNAITVAVSFAIFTFSMMGSCVLCEYIYPRLTQTESKYNKYRVLAFLISIVAIAVLAMILQFFYGMGMGTKVSDFIFVIDDSGSMDQNDPFEERYDAVMQLANTLSSDDRIAMVKFSDSILDSIPLEYNTPNYRDEFEQRIKGTIPNGGTDIELALREATRLSDTGDTNRYTMVILLSDGDSDVDIEGITDVLIDRGIILNTIGLNVSLTGVDLLETMAKSTGGEFYDVFDAKSLIPIMKGMEKHIMRNSLLGPRAVIKRDSTIHKIARVAFIAILNIALGIALQFIIDNRLLRWQIVVSAITGIIAGLILEIGFYYVWPATLVRILAFLVMTIIIVNYEIPELIPPSGYGNEIDIFARPEAEYNDEDLWRKN